MNFSGTLKDGAGITWPKHEKPEESSSTQQIDDKLQGNTSLIHQNIIHFVTEILCTA